jgi:transposase-like protein
MKAEERAQYEPAEQQALRACLTRGEPPHCPRCGVTMTARPIGGGSFGLGYARQRHWLICPSCRRSAIFDVRRGTRT